MYDEPLALTAAEQDHFDGCPDCRSRFDSTANSARAAAAWLQTPTLTAEPASALVAFRQRLASQAARPRPWYQRWIESSSPRLRPVTAPLLAVGLAAVLLTGVTATGAAGHLVRVFEPSRVAAVPVSPSAVRNAANVFLDYGKVKWLPTPPQPQVVTDAATARTKTGLPLLMPASLPRGVNGTVAYGVVSQTTGSLTFDAARLQASAAAAGVKVNPMPSSINGSTLVVTAGPALIEAWGVSAANPEGQLPTLIIAQTRVPTVDSTGASASQLEAYLLSQPGVPADLAAPIKALKDPTRTLPIPVPTGLATTQPVQVDGVQGLLIRAAVGAGVVWVKNGVIYAVGGQLSPDQVLAIATTLH